MDMGFATIGFIELIMLIGLGGGSGLPLGVPPEPEKPLMAAVAPEECLFYTTWSAMAQPDPASQNQTEQLLAEPEVQHMVSEIERHISEGVTKVAQKETPESLPLFKEAVGMVKTFLTSSVAMFVTKVEMGPEGPKVEAGLLVCTEEKTAKIRASLEAYQALFLRGKVESIQINGKTWHRIKLAKEAPEITWGTLGKYIIVGVGENAVEGIVARSKQQPPKWLADLREQLPVERCSTVSYINVKGIIAVAMPMAGPASGKITSVLGALGLDSVTAISSVTGMEGEGFLSKSLLAIDGQPRGVLELLAATPLTAADLAPIPADATIAIALRADLDTVLQKGLAIIGEIEPRAKDEFAMGISQGEKALGVSLRDDVLKPLGDVWCVYNSPAEGGLLITGLTVVAQVEDHEKLLAVQQKLLILARTAMDQPRSSRRPGPRIRQFEFKGQTICFFDARDNDFVLAPAWCLTEKELIVATFPQNIKAYLSRGEKHRSLAEVPAVAEALKSGSGPVMLSYIDTQEVFDMVYPLVPMLGQVILSELAKEGIDVDISILPSAPAIRKHLRPGVSTVRLTPAGIEATSTQTLPGGSVVSVLPIIAGVGLPAVTSARSSARRAMSMNNLKQMTIAMMTYEADNRKFPAAYSVDKDGKPLLSWRVHLLPYLGPKGLYEKFKLDESWNSEHNRKLLPQMPKIYESQDWSNGPGMTHYMTIRGEKTAFPGKNGLRLADMKDGSSYTIMIVEAEEQVPWTAPLDHEYDAKNPAEGLVNSRRNGFIAAFCDGSVRLIPHHVDPEKLNAMFTRDGRETVNDR